MSSDDPTDGKPAYTVGRGRPPQHSRFRKGQSGNPGGRKRGCRNIKTLMEEAMAIEVPMNVNGDQRRIGLVFAVVLAQGQAALKGNMRAAEHLLNRYERLRIGEEGERQRGLPDEDRIILERAKQRLGTVLSEDDIVEDGDD